MNKSAQKFFSVLSVLSLTAASLPQTPSVSLPKNLAYKSFVQDSAAQLKVQSKAPSSAPAKLSWWNCVKVIAVFFLACLLPTSPTGCVKGGGSDPQQVSAPIPIPAPQLSLNEHADWLVSRIQAATVLNGSSSRNLNGLIKSYESSDDLYAHVYNQAQAAMALLVADYQSPGKGYRSRAEAILTRLMGLQNADGSFSAAFHLTNPAQDLAEKQTGAIAFVGLAVNLYTQKTENEQFVPMGEKIADYLVAKAIERPAFPGKAIPNEDGAALSVEENLAAYAFLQEFAPISFDSNYVNTALAIRQFLESLWNNPQGWWRAGRNSGLENGESVLNGDFDIQDNNYYADTQFAALALGNSGETDSSFDFTRPINPNQGFSVKSQLQTNNILLPNGIAFDAGSRNFGQPNEQNWDAAQTARFANALRNIGRRLNAPVDSAFFEEANRQLIQAEALAIISSPGAVGINAATGKSGTHGGILLTLFPRGNVGPDLGPSVEATAEAIFAKATFGGFNGVNFYRASEAITQFSSLEQSLKRQVLETLYSQSKVETYLRYFQLLEKPLGSITENKIQINPNHLNAVWNTLKSALPVEKLSRLVAETYGDFVLAVIHHEAIVHPSLSKQLEQMDQKEKAISDVMSSSPALQQLFSIFTMRCTLGYTEGNSQLDVVEEFLAQLISYVTYPKGATLTSFIEDPKIQKLLQELPGSAETAPLQKLVAQVKKFFPTIAPLFEKTVHNKTLAERKQQVTQQLQALNGHIRFDNKEALLALVQPLAFEVAL